MTAKKVITPEEIREYAARLHLPYTQIARNLGIDINWMSRMIQHKESRYRFITPNPERMKLIMKYLKAYEKFQREWK